MDRSISHHCAENSAEQFSAYHKNEQDTGYMWYMYMLMVFWLVTYSGKHISVVLTM